MEASRYQSSSLCWPQNASLLPLLLLMIGSLTSSQAFVCRLWDVASALLRRGSISVFFLVNLVILTIIASSKLGCIVMKQSLQQEDYDRHCLAAAFLGQKDASTRVIDAAGVNDAAAIAEARKCEKRPSISHHLCVDEKRHCQSEAKALTRNGSYSLRRDVTEVKKSRNISRDGADDHRWLLHEPETEINGDGGDEDGDGVEELNRRVEDFIARFNQRMRHESLPPAM